MCVYLYLCLNRIWHQQQDYWKQFHPFLSICPLPHVTLLALCLSVLSVYLCWPEKSRSGCVCSFNKCFFMQIITLIMLLYTSFPSCLSDKTHQCGLSMAEYTHPWYPVQFSIDRRCSVPESWHTVLWFDDCLDHFLFFPCQDLLVPTPFLLTEWLLLRSSSSVWCLYKCCWNSNCKCKYRSTVFAYVTCTYMSCFPALTWEGPVSQSKSIHLSE